ncbi:MAG: response regulator [Desulfovibrio sp.]|nr:response regulator [Desulfovibrio sp.]MBI4961228.1 response regulator [Desulfovibrio sp.]
MPARILFVDDDQQALESCQAMLQKHFEVATSSDPAQALAQIRASGPFAVVVSALKLKRMDGIEFLIKVRELHPETVCIMLTGFADVNVAIKALNQGHVFRFLTKPCLPETMFKALEAGIRQYYTNIAEKEILQKTLMGSVRMLIEALSLANPAAYGRTRRVRNLVKNMAKALEKKIPWELDLATMLSHIGCMSIPRKILDDITAGKELTKSDMKLYHSHPIVGANLLEQIPRLESVAAIIAAQFQEFNPGQSESVRFLKVAVEYDMLLSTGLAPYEAYGRMKAYKHRYDPVMLEALEKCIAEEGGYALKFAAIIELKPNMVLAEDIVSRNGVLLLSRGTMLDQDAIDALTVAHETFNIVEPVTVVMPSKVGPINLEKTISSLVELFKHQMEAKGIYFTLELDKALPPYFKGRQDHVKQVLFNLLSNAFKFSESGQITVCASPIFEAKSGKLKNILFIVSDSGYGMPDILIESIFEFDEPKPAMVKKHVQKKILGLTIVMRLVKLMHGSLCILSKVDLGTDVYFTIEAAEQPGEQSG